jgi:hypothetical protein
VSIDYEDSRARARPGPAFSNGTEWECWSAGWCDRCARDAPFRNGISERGCPLILIAVADELIPAEWMEPEPSPSGRPYLGPKAYTCIEFRAPGGGGPEPQPKPDPPDMDGLFERPPRRTRMFVQPPPYTVSYRQPETVQTTGERL